MHELVTCAARVAVLLRKRQETVAVAESSAGGLISALLGLGEMDAAARSPIGSQVLPDDILQHLKSVWVVGQQLRIVADGQPFDTPRKPGKLGLGDDQPRTDKPRFKKPRPAKGPGHAFPPRKPFAKAAGGKGKPKS